MKTTWRILSVLLSVYMMITGFVFGQVPQLINYQGVLVDPATGQPVPDDSYTITFSIYDVASGGSAIWTETQSVQTKDGLYSVLLGSSTALTPTILSGTEKYLGIKVGSDPEMTPRKRIVSVAYAIISDDAYSLGGTAASEFPTKSELSISDGNPPNQGSNLVSWDNLKNVPEGFADGVDNTGGGGGWVDDGTFVRLETSGDSVKIGSYIGVTGEKGKLDVAGNIRSVGEIKAEQMYFPDIRTSIRLKPYPDQSVIATNNLYLDYNGSLYFREDGNEMMRINTGGNVGIGDSSPTHTLDVAGKIGINDIQVLYLPDQTDFAGTLYLGDGGGSLSQTEIYDGQHNTAIGIGALYANTTASGNTACGHLALYSNTTGNGNTANGIEALRSNTTGYSNTACGSEALEYNTTGYANTAVGMGALHYNSGSLNTGIGCWAAGEVECTYGTFLGAWAQPNTDGYSNVMGLGYQAKPTASNQVMIGNSSVTSIGGYAGWTNFSDGRYKLAVTENVKGLDFIMKLRPVTYQLDVNRLAADLKEDQRRDEKGNITTESSDIDIKARNEKSQIVYTGFIGQEVEQAANDIGYNFSGVDAPRNDNDFYGLRYAEFVVPLVKAVQEQQKKIEQLENRIVELEKKLDK